VSNENSLVQVLLDKIPGFGAYREATRLRDDDLEARKFVAMRLAECKGNLDRLAAQAVKGLLLDEVVEIENVRADVDRGRSRIENAIAGYRSVWESRGASVELIQDALQIDHALVSIVDRMDAAARESIGNPKAFDATTSRELARELHAQIDRREQLLDADS